MDSNQDGVVTIDEFLECCRKDQTISSSMGVFDSTIWPNRIATNAEQQPAQSAKSCRNSHGRHGNSDNKNSSFSNTNKSNNNNLSSNNKTSSNRHNDRTSSTSSTSGAGTSSGQQHKNHRKHHQNRSRSSNRTSTIGNGHYPMTVPMPTGSRSYSKTRNRPSTSSRLLHQVLPPPGTDSDTTTRPNDVSLNVSNNLNSLQMREVYEQPKLVTVKTWYTAVAKQGVTC